MAIFDLSGSDAGFDMSSASAVNISGTQSGSAAQFAFLSVAGDNVTLFSGSNNFTYDGSGDPTGGTATGGEIDLGDDDPANPEVVFSGFSGSLVAMSGGAAAFYGAILKGHDTVTGSDFDDTLNGLGGGDVILGGDGDDQIDAGAGVDYVAPGNGQDDSDGGTGNDFLDLSLSAEGGAVIRMTTGAVTFSAYVESHQDYEQVQGTTGDDSIIGTIGADIAAGHSGNDTISGSTGRDSLSGGLGHDLLFGGADGDFQFGSDGNDVIRGGIGADTLLGGLDNDDLAGQSGRDSLQGDAGADTLFGFGSHDSLFGGDGNDDLRGGFGRDLLNGSANDDVVRGFEGDDRLFGGGGSDTLFGNDEDDLLIGGGGGDRLKGDAGDDTLVGSFGADLVTGGSGDDIFAFRRTHAADAVTDFTPGAASEDVIRLVAFGAAFDTFAEVMTAATQVGADVVIDFGGGDVLTLQAVTLGALHDDDFQFT